MASTFNSFAFLHGTGEPAVVDNQLAKKKKNKNKKKKPAQQEGAAPAKQSEVAPGGTAPATTNDFNDQNEESDLMPVAEAMAHVEKAAISRKSGNDRVRLWSQWTTQIENAKRGDDVVYVAHDESLVGFREMLVMSNAVETTVESCVWDAIAANEHAQLEALLRACLRPSCSHTCRQIADSIAQLGAASQACSPDVKSAVARAVRAVVASLKDGSSSAGGAADNSERVHALQQQADEKLFKLESLPKDPAAARERSVVSKELVSLTKGRLQLLAGGSAAGAASSVEAALQPLRDAERIIASSLQKAEQGGAARGAAAQQQQQQRRKQASYAASQKEVESIDEQLHAVNARIAAAEKELQQLRAQAHELEMRRMRACDDQQAAMNAFAPGAPAAAGRGQAGGAAAAEQLRRQLACTQQLIAVVSDAAAHGGGATAAAQQSDAPVAYVHAVSGCINATMAYMQDLATKADAAKSRLERNMRLASLQKGNAAADAAKMRADVEKQLADITATSAALTADAEAMVRDLKTAAANLSHVSDYQMMYPHMLTSINKLHDMHAALCNKVAKVEPAPRPAAANTAPTNAPAPAGGQRKKWTLDQILAVDVSNMGASNGAAGGNARAAAAQPPAAAGVNTVTVGDKTYDLHGNDPAAALREALQGGGDSEEERIRQQMAALQMQLQQVRSKAGNGNYARQAGNDARHGAAWNSAHA